MTEPRLIEKTITGASLATLVIAVALIYPSNGFAQDLSDNDERVTQGLAIAPVPLNMTGKNRALVGLGSYIVNAQGDCSGCHTSPDPFASGGDPHLGQPRKENAAAYLGGGQAFGPFLSRNLTPDYSGVPEGGHPFSEFLQMIRTGVDLERQHPDMGPLLQVMPWPAYQNMTDRDLRAIYEYLSTIPCVEGGPGTRPNRCLPPVPVPPTAPPTISLLPTNLTTNSRTLMLDASGSKSTIGGPVRYVWENVLGSPYVLISDPNSPTPTVTFVGGRGLYSIGLSVIDQTGGTTSMQVKINYTGT